MLPAHLCRERGLRLHAKRFRSPWATAGLLHFSAPSRTGSVIWVDAPLDRRWSRQVPEITYNSAKKTQNNEKKRANNNAGTLTFFITSI